MPQSKRVLWIIAALLILICGVGYYFFMPVAEVAIVRRGPAISAVYGTVRIEPAFVVHVRAQNSGFIQLAEEFSAGRGAIGKSVTKLASDPAFASIRKEPRFQKVVHDMGL